MEKLSLEHDLSSNSPMDPTHNQVTNFEDDTKIEKIKIDMEVSPETDLNDEKIDSTDNEILDIENSPEDLVKTPSESVDIEVKDANTTNCLALTIQEEHKLVAVKNVFIRSIRMSWKVVVSAITLAIIRLFT